MEMVARKLEVTPERAYEVATFYVMFHVSKPGKYVVEVCTNLSCSLWGAEELLAYLETKLGVRAGEQNTTWTLREAECLASCGTAPCLQINQVHHENLRSRLTVDAVFAQLKPAS
jgi:NADH-quinone oxidoreductase subunit E